jgi:hypothetical protein
MNVQIFGTTKISVLGLPLESPGEKWHLDIVLVERHKVYYREDSGTFSQRSYVVTLALGLWSRQRMRWATSEPKSHISCSRECKRISGNEHLDVGLMARHIVYYKGKVLASFKFEPWWVLWIRVCPWLVYAPTCCLVCASLCE